MIDILQPGLLTTVQDLGRHGWTHLGVSPAGACDPLSLRIGNLLVGNPEDAPALEFSFTTGALRFETDALISLTGAECDGAQGRQWTSFHVQAGEVLRPGNVRRGAHAYLCVAGGISTDHVLGSAATHLPSRLGGMHGKPLRKGDRLAIGATCKRRERVLPPGYESLLVRRQALRVTSGAHMDAFASRTVYDFFSHPFIVAKESNRQGLRVDGPPLNYPGEITSEGVALGNVQVLPGGGAVILSVDSQTTGGYPVIAGVISADWPGVGQLRPGDEIRFAPVTLPDAIAALQEQERLFDALRKALS